MHDLANFPALALFFGHVARVATDRTWGRSAPLGSFDLSGLLRLRDTDRLDPSERFVELTGSHSADQAVDERRQCVLRRHRFVQ